MTLILRRFLPEQFVHLLDLVRILGGDVIELRPVMRNVIQFVGKACRILADGPGDIPRRTHDLGASDPAVMIDGMVAHHLEVLRMVSGRRVRIGLDQRYKPC